MYKVGLIRVLTIEDEGFLNIHGKIIEEAFPEIRVISRCIEDQPKGIYDSESEKVAKPKILRLIKEFETEKVDAVIVSCMADPAVEEARRHVNIPVIGAGTSSALLALAIGDRVGVIKIGEETPQIIRKILGQHLVAEEKPDNVDTALGLREPAGVQASLNALKKIINRQVDVVIPACTGFSTIRFASLAKKITSIPIIDPVISSGAMTLSILKQRNF